MDNLARNIEFPPTSSALNCPFHSESEGEVPVAPSAQTPSALNCPFHSESEGETALGGRPSHTEGEGEKRPRRRYADYKKWDDDIRRELIGGRVYMMGAPTSAHQAVSMALSAQFYNYLVGKSCRVYAAPFDVRLFAPCSGEDDESDRDIVQPDISIICDKAKRHKEGCRGAPDMVVEILSASNRSHDTLLKFNKYLEAGVREYWVIDPDDKVLQVHTLIQNDGGNRYATAVYGADAKVKVGIFDDCSINLGEVFAAAEETE